ncbi:MAG: glycoside hydrolase family 5 protein [Lachnospiraceae bacterium]|nr:glycoside hydrolase family 5 protein [Lachnospiraceae bacterium]
MQNTEPATEPPTQNQPADSGTPFGSHGRLSVTGTRLTDQYGAAYTLRGISTHGLSWFPDYVNYDMFKQMRDEWNVNVVRLAMYTAEYNGYCTGDMNNRENLKKLIDDGVKYAGQLGLYVIIDWHILSDGNPNMYKNESMEFFREISAKYAGYGNVIYEICNEPNGGTGWGEIKSYAQDVINIIRSNDSRGIIIVGTPTWSQDVDIAADDRINGENIMYAMHFYADTHRDYIRDKLVSAVNKGLPVIVSEFGICDASGNGGINYDEASKWMSLLNQYSVSYVLWNLSNKSETSAMIQSWCGKQAGITYDELSDAGKWFVNFIK